MRRMEGTERTATQTGKSESLSLVNLGAGANRAEEIINRQF